MSMIIEAYIPYGSFKVIKDGTEVKNLVGFEFEANVNNPIPKLTLRYGDIYKDLDEYVEGRKTALHLSNDVQKLRIEILSNIDVKISFDNIHQDLVQNIKVEADVYGENKVEVTYVVGV